MQMDPTRHQSLAALAAPFPLSPRTAAKRLHQQRELDTSGALPRVFLPSFTEHAFPHGLQSLRLEKALACNNRMTNNAVACLNAYINMTQFHSQCPDPREFLRCWRF